MTSGSRRFLAGAALLLLVPLASGCFRVFGYGFSGGGLPGHVKTVAVIPFENRTSESTITQLLTDQLVDAFRDRLGLRVSSEARANAVVRGTITRFDPDVPVAFSADPGRTAAARRRLVISVDIEVIDQVTGQVLWKRQGMSQEGEYAEREADAGLNDAVRRLVNDVIEGVQSQW
jgi:hypothetical protein